MGAPGALGSIHLHPLSPQLGAALSLFSQNPSPPTLWAGHEHSGPVGEEPGDREDSERTSHLRCFSLLGVVQGCFLRHYNLQLLSQDQEPLGFIDNRQRCSPSSERGAWNANQRLGTRVSRKQLPNVSGFNISSCRSFAGLVGTGTLEGERLEENGVCCKPGIPAFLWARQEMAFQRIT